MTPEERERMIQLCTLVQTEKDPEKFDALVKELNHLIETSTNARTQSTNPNRKRLSISTKKYAGPRARINPAF